MPLPIIIILIETGKGKQTSNSPENIWSIAWASWVLSNLNCVTIMATRPPLKALLTRLTNRWGNCTLVILFDLQCYPSQDSGNWTELLSTCGTVPHYARNKQQKTLQRRWAIVCHFPCRVLRSSVLPSLLFNAFMVSWKSSLNRTSLSLSII